MTTKAEISCWFNHGVQEKATHMIVVCDTYDWEDFPVYVKEGEDFWQAHAMYNGGNMSKIMEVYDLRADKDEQMGTGRVMRTPLRR